MTDIEAKELLGLSEINLALFFRFRRLLFFHKMKTFEIGNYVRLLTINFMKKKKRKRDLFLLQ